MAKLSFAIFPFRKGHPAPGGNGNGTSNESVFQATDLPTLSCSACSCRNCPWRCLPAGKNTDIQLCEPSAVNQCAGHHFFTYEDYLFGAPTLSRLFKTNGFPSGTVLVKDIFPGGNSSLNELTEANGLLFFGPPMQPMDRNCGKATAPQPVRFSSRISISSRWAAAIQAV